MGDSRQEGSPLTAWSFTPAQSCGSCGSGPEGAKLMVSQLRLLRPSSNLELPQWGNYMSWSGDSSLHGVETASSTQLTVNWYSAGVLALPFFHRVNPLHPEGLRGGYCGLPRPSWWPVSGQGPQGYTFRPRCDEAQARSRVPHWDLAVVLEALCRPPSEPIEDISDRLLTLKTVFLLAISSLKRVGDLQALSVDPSYLDLASGLAKLFCTFLWGMSLRSLPLHHGLSYFRIFVHLPSESPTRRGFIVCVQCEHWMRTSTELPCCMQGENNHGWVIWQYNYMLVNV